MIHDASDTRQGRVCRGTHDRTGTRTTEGFGARLITPLLLGSVLNPVNSTMIATALASIGADLHVGAAATAWLVASLYVASAVGQPAMGRLADLLGPRRVFLSGLLLVGAAGVLGALAPDLGWLIGSRALLGVGTSAAYPAAMALLRAQSQRLGRETPRPVLGLLSLASLSSAAVGPVLGGLLAATLGWRAIFAVNVPLALVALVTAVLWLPGGKPRPSGEEGPRRSASLDPLGVTLFAVTLTTAMVFLMGLANPRWWLLPLVAVLAAALARWELRRPQPFIDLRMLTRNRALATTYLRHGLAYLIIYCVMYGYAQWLEQSHGFSSFAAGLIMLPMSVAAAVCSLLGARTKGIRAPLTLAAALLVCGSAALLLAYRRTPLALLLLVAVLFGLPQGLSSTGNQAAVYAQAPPGGTGAAAGLQRTAQYIGAITAAALIGLYYGRRATDAGLHAMAATVAVLGLALFAVTVADRALRPGLPTPRK
ncbi:MFS transporter [Streptomyces sp. RB6PN25]|uniref:MFS transporter n=1 Tax=Streptomyces humicola TaxID=2953240 RepID=A0ABT1Q428_9ACTN|nr:MFS transporter [Streptomyces humicola]MCQ4084647.1 MFS transporter [Streptomyces humicola]